MTRKEKAGMRAWYAYQQLRFRADGSVEARPGLGHPWGLLYSREDAERHIKAVDQRHGGAK